jgi:hypothetical protein
MKRSVDWWSLPRQSRLAAVLYPHLTDAETQRDMAEIARGENKKSPLQGRVDAETARLEQQNPKGRR